MMMLSKSVTFPNLNLQINESATIIMTYNDITQSHMNKNPVSPTPFSSDINDVYKL